MMIMIAVMGIQALVVHGGETPDHPEFQTHLATGHDYDHGHHHLHHHHHPSSPSSPPNNDGDTRILGAC